MRLITVAHGTRKPGGNQVARQITERAGRLLGVPAIPSFVELCDPLLAEVLLAAQPGDVVVPMLLSSGYHLRVVVPAAIAAGACGVRMGGSLGPDPLLAEAMADRLADIGAAPGQPVVMVAAGSQDTTALADLTAAAGLLAERCHGPVQVATLAGLGDRIRSVVTPDHAVVPYLLAPGFFATQARHEAEVAGSTCVAEVLGAHPRVVDLVASRALTLAGATA